ncbi:MAG: response regulator [Alphaproteobacteria bacterium]|nr:response regulator [Alphaproteobacteria bacterium]
MTVRILVVDDEPDVEALIRQKFRREVRQGQYALEFVLSGPATLAALHTDADGPDLLLLSDINVPGMSWLGLLQQVTSQWPELPVIVFISDDDPATVRRAKEAGAHAVYAKPIDFVALRAKIDRRQETHGGGM